MTATTTLTTALTTALAAKLEAHNAKNAEKNALKLKIANEIASEIKSAKENGGATFADLRHIVTLAGCAAEKFAEDLSCNGSEILETAEQRAENFKHHQYNLQNQIRAMSLGAKLCGIEDADSRKHSIDVLSFSFERNEQSLSSLFDWWETKDDSRKIAVIDTICKQFHRLKLGFARNVPKFDQRYIDAGLC